MAADQISTALPRSDPVQLFLAVTSRVEALGTCTYNSEPFIASLGSLIHRPRGGGESSLVYTVCAL